MSSILTVSKEFRADVLRNDKAMLRQLSSAYKTIERSLNQQLKALIRDIQAAQRRGETVNENWLRRQFRYQQLLRQVKVEINGFSNGAMRFITSKQSDALFLGADHANALLQSADVGLSFYRLPTGAIEEMVGTFSNGSPLSKVFDRLGNQAAKDIKDALVSGLGSGHGAAKIARELTRAVDVPRWRAMAIARTEVIRAYRQSTLQTYAENDDVVSGWTWLSTQSVRTCAACWALHGTFFPLSRDFFPGHVSCRCTSIPEVKGNRLNVQSGSVLFGNLPAVQQQTILGPTRYEMYARGTPLSDFVMLAKDREWGSAYQVKPLYKLRSRKRAA